MIAQHAYLHLYPIEPDSKLLILGTIRPHDTNNFLIPFFYDNKNSIWNSLSDAFPGALDKDLIPETLNQYMNYYREQFSM